MNSLVADTKLKLVSYCHLKPVTVPIPCTIPVDERIFPAAVEGFTAFSVATHFTYVGSTMALLDISGLTREEIEDRLRRERYTNQSKVLPVDFLRCLEWVHAAEYRDKFEFDCIAAYLTNGETTAAEPCSQGFRCLYYLDNNPRWPEKTLGLFNIQEL